jgi:magnesium-transporting ATPase (P-type)
VFSGSGSGNGEISLAELSKEDAIRAPTGNGPGSSASGVGSPTTISSGPDNPSSMDVSVSLDWHKLQVSEIVRQYDTNIDIGLSSRIVIERQAKWGPNALDKEAQLPLWKAFLLQFANPLIAALIISSIISMALAEYANGTAILVTILLNTFIAVYTEHSAGNALAALAKMSQATCRVIRDGQTVDIASELIIPVCHRSTLTL